MRCKPRKIALPLLSLILPLSGCVQTPVAVDCPPRPPLPASLSKLPPPEGTAQACLQELSAGQTSGPACATLHVWLTK